jgi:hypothetical protein
MFGCQTHVRVRHWHDTDTYSYIKLCHFFKLSSMSIYQYMYCVWYSYRCSCLIGFNTHILSYFSGKIKFNGSLTPQPLDLLIITLIITVHYFFLSFLNAFMLFCDLSTIKLRKLEKTWEKILKKIQILFNMIHLFALNSLFI